MLFLSGDIFFNRVDPGKTDGKNSISFLPREVTQDDAKNGGLIQRFQRWGILNRIAPRVVPRGLGTTAGLIDFIPSGERAKLERESLLRRDRVRQTGYCIYLDTFFQGQVPILTDGDDKYIVFVTELEAQKEVADYAITRLKQFLDGKRDFDDAISVQEYVVPVTLHSDGSFTDEQGRSFGPKPE